MADRFLLEIRDMHQLRKDIRSLPPAKEPSPRSHGRG
jgi:hypothetical protein